MKRLIPIILIFALCLTFISCGEKYPPVESTEEETKTVMTIKKDGKVYDIPYELYRTFFLQYKSDVDGGDASVWSGAQKEQYIEKIDALIFARICEIYAVLHLCTQVGIDIYSDVVEDSIDDYITVSVEGGSVDGMLIEGFDGDYDEYLMHLKSLNMNYSVSELMFRYSVCSELLDEYYSDKTASGTKISFTREDVKEFYDGEECVRVLQMFLSDTSFNEERAKQLRDGISRQDNEADAATYMISYSLASESLRDGVVIGKYALDPAYYEKYTDAAFAILPYETSEVIRVITGMIDGYYILYKTEKSDAHFEKCYDEIEAVYVQNRLGKELDAIKSAFMESISITEELSSLDRAAISME